jgi:hypothetical protein
MFGTIFATAKIADDPSCDTTIKQFWLGADGRWISLRVHRPVSSGAGS